MRRRLGWSYVYGSAYWCDAQAAVLTDAASSAAASSAPRRRPSAPASSGVRVPAGVAGMSGQCNVNV